MVKSEYHDLDRNYTVNETCTIGNMSLSIRELVAILLESSELHSSDRIGQQGKKDQWPSWNSGPTLYCGVSATRAIDPIWDPLSPIALKYRQHASRRWACYHHTAHSTSLEARVLSGRWIAAHPWLVLQGDWGQRISTGIDGSHGWNSAIQRRSWVRARSLVLFPLSPYPVWAVKFTTF